jgi:hypothetical protein
MQTEGTLACLAMGTGERFYAIVQHHDGGVWFVMVNKTLTGGVQSGKAERRP